MSTDTPRTDEQFVDDDGSYGFSTVHDIIEFARQLERELAAARVEVERLTKCLLKANSSTEEFERKWYLCSDELDALKSECDALRVDAERYRYMRSSSVFQDRNGPGLYWYLPRDYRDLPKGQRLDAAIDAARKG